MQASAGKDNEERSGDIGTLYFCEEINRFTEYTD